MRRCIHLLPWYVDGRADLAREESSITDCQGGEIKVAYHLDRALAPPHRPGILCRHRTDRRRRSVHWAGDNLVRRELEI